MATPTIGDKHTFDVYHRKNISRQKNISRIQTHSQTHLQQYFVVILLLIVKAICAYCARSLTYPFSLTFRFIGLLCLSSTLVSFRFKWHMHMLKCRKFSVWYSNVWQLAAHGELLKMTIILKYTSTSIHSHHRRRRCHHHHYCRRRRFRCCRGLYCHIHYHHYNQKTNSIPSELHFTFGYGRCIQMTSWVKWERTKPRLGQKINYQNIHQRKVFWQRQPQQLLFHSFQLDECAHPFYLIRWTSSAAHLLVVT